MLQTIGVCMTCMAMFGNGVVTGMILIQTYNKLIQMGLILGLVAYFAEVAVIVPPTHAGLLAAFSERQVFTVVM